VLRSSSVCIWHMLPQRQERRSPVCRYQLGWQCICNAGGSRIHTADWGRAQPQQASCSKQCSS
jgi:hypothetical protein